MGKPLTAEHLEKLKAGREAKKNATPDPSLRSDFKDDDTWHDLAIKHKVRLPHWGTPLTTGVIENWLHKLNIPLKAYYDWFGDKTMRAFIDMNPTWPARAFAGLLLEAHDSGQFR